MGRKEVEVVLKGKDEGASTAVERLAQRLKLMRQESKRAGEGALERTLGSGRGLSGAALDAAGLGIQSIVVEAIGGAFENATAKAIEMRDAMKEGKATAGDFANEMAHSVPILGHFVQAWQNIGELITGAQAKARKLGDQMNDQADAAENRSKQRAGALDEATAANKDAAGRIEDAYGGSSSEVEKRRLNRTHNDRIKSLEDRKKGITDQSVLNTVDQAIAKENTAHNAEMAKVDADYRRQKIEEVRKSEQDLKAMREDAHADALRVLGQEQAAELAAIAFAGEQKKRAIAEQARAQDDGIVGPERDRLYEQAAEKRRLVDVETASKVAKYRNDISAKEAEKNKQRRQDAIDQEIQDTQKGIEQTRDGLSTANQRRAQVSATLVNDRFTDQAGLEKDKETARIQENTAKAYAVLVKMEQHLEDLKKQKGRAL